MNRRRDEPSGAGPFPLYGLRRLAGSRPSAAVPLALVAVAIMGLMSFRSGSEPRSSSAFVQGATPDFVTEVKARLGSGFGGAWIVPTSSGGTVHVGVASLGPSS